MYDVIVIGAGIAGLISALRMAQSGRRVGLLAAGVGATHLTGGTIDVLGQDKEQWAESPASTLPDFIAQHPEHPYSCVGIATLQAALLYFQEQMQAQGVRYVGELERNRRVVTPSGAFKPTCLVPESMTSGAYDPASAAHYLIAGVRELRDFYPRYIADNLTAAQVAGGNKATARHALLAWSGVRGRSNISPAQIALEYDQSNLSAYLLQELQEHARADERIGLPAVLGLQRGNAFRQLSDALGVPVFEIPTLPPSVLGMRVFAAFRRALHEAGARLNIGFPVIQADTAGRRVERVFVQSSVRPIPYRAKAFILATGGIFGSGIATDYRGKVWETIFDLPLHAPSQRSQWFRQNIHHGQPIYNCGVQVDEQMRPVHPDGTPVYENLFAAGALLSGWDGPREKSGDGVSIATGYAAAASALQTIG